MIFPPFGFGGFLGRSRSTARGNNSASAAAGRRIVRGNWRRCITPFAIEEPIFAHLAHRHELVARPAELLAVEPPRRAGSLVDSSFQPHALLGFSVEKTSLLAFGIVAGGIGFMT